VAQDKGVKEGYYSPLQPLPRCLVFVIARETVLQFKLLFLHLILSDRGFIAVSVEVNNVCRI
jgi:hypothetical protein